MILIWIMFGIVCVSGLGVMLYIHSKSKTLTLLELKILNLKDQFGQIQVIMSVVNGNGKEERYIGRKGDWTEFPSLETVENRYMILALDKILNQYVFNYQKELGGELKEGVVITPSRNL